MSKREEIREGTAKAIYTTQDYNYTWGEWDSLSPILKQKYYDIVDASFFYLHSQDVAIKVEGELPENTVKNGKGWKCAHAVFVGHHYETLVECPLFKAGYTAWEPLIEDK